jgi:hypothetical protein
MRWAVDGEGWLVKVDFGVDGEAIGAINGGRGLIPVPLSDPSLE